MDLKEKEVILEVFDQSYLEKSFLWLSDPEVKRLTDTPNFSKKSQKEWFDNIPNNKDYLIWGVKYTTKQIGACGLKKIKEGTAEYWGYIGEKEMWGKGIGEVMLQKCLKKAHNIQLKVIWLKVLEDNERAVRLYRKIGFIEYNRVNRYIYMKL